MDNRQQRTLASFENVLIYLQQHPITPEPPLLAGMKRSLQKSVAKIRELHVTQHSARAGKNDSVTARIRKLRREHMMPLVRIVKPLLAFAPGVDRALTVPHARTNAYSVAKAALAMADALKPHTKLLISAGYSRNYLREFRKEASDLALATKSTASARSVRSKATAALAAEFRNGMRTVTVIEGLIMRQTGANKTALALWKNRRRVSARIGRPRRKRKDALGTNAQLQANA